MFLEYAKEQAKQFQQLIDGIDYDALEACVDILVDAHAKGSGVFIVGNGGSAATSSHWACDLGKGASVDGYARFRVMSLTDNTPTITAIANDYSYDDIFVEQLKNLFAPGDVLIAISCSGNSPNVVKAIEFAKENGGKTIGILGFGGGKSQQLADVHLTADSHDYGLVESLHMFIEHVISFSFKKRFEGQLKGK